MAITNIFTDDWDNYTHNDVEESLKDILQTHESALSTIQGVVAQVQAQAITQEADPTVPAWAKQPTKPTYTAEEVGAMPADAAVSNITYDEDTTTLNII